MRLTKASPKAVRYACLHFHYAKAVPVNTLGYNVYNDNDEWCGVVLFGSGSNNNIGNEYKLKQGQVFELVRVALNGKQSCTSQCVALALKALHKDCPLCRLVVSYADCDQNHLGTIYQATNWFYVGTMMQNEHDSSWIIHGKRYHGRIISDWVRNRGGLQGLTRLQFLQKYYDINAKPYITKGKRKYLMPMDKAMRRQIEPMRKPYPKTDADWHKIDRSQFKHNDDASQQ
jgi:hypothetical protein